MTNNRELLSQPDTGCRPPRGFDYTPAVLQSQTGAKLSPCSSSQLRGKFPPTHRTGTRSGFATPRIALHRRKSPISIISIGELIEEFAFATPEPISREPSQSRYTKSIHVKKKKIIPMTVRNSFRVFSPRPSRERGASLSSRCSESTFRASHRFRVSSIDERDPFNKLPLIRHSFTDCSRVTS